MAMKVDDREQVTAEVLISYPFLVKKYFGLFPIVTPQPIVSPGWNGCAKLGKLTPATHKSPLILRPIESGDIPGPRLFDDIVD